MRSAVVLLFALSASCLASAPGPRLNEEGHVVRGDDPAPAPVLAAEASAVTIYVEATCDRLDQANGRGSGFWLTPRIVVSAGHLMQARNGIFPTFALVGADGGCIEGQYGDWNETADVLFILARQSHPAHLALADRLPKEGEAAYQLSYETRGPDGAMRFSRRRLGLHVLNDSKVYFTARPAPRAGDSGSPLVGADGKVLGIALAVGMHKDELDRPMIGLYLSAMAIRFFQSQCGPCDEE